MYSYTAVIRERLGAEFPSFRRDRPWFHGERAARVRWSRDEPGVVHVLGARFRDPSMGPDHRQFFPGLRTERFATDPFVDPFTFGYSVVAPATLPNTTTLSPLEHGSERHYQFRSGDTISVQLLDGGTRQAVAVTVTPRYASIRLVSAIMWIDPESFGLARVAYRLAKPVDREISWQLRTGGRWRPGFHVDIGPGDPADTAVATDSTPTRPGVFDRLVNGVFNNVFPRFEMDISTVVADYGFWEMRHWLLRGVTWRGHIIAEEVTASGVAPPAVPVTIDWTLEIEGIRESGAEAMPGTPATAAEALEAVAAGGRQHQCGTGDGRPWMKRLPSHPQTGMPSPPATCCPRACGKEIRAVDDATLERIAAELASIGTGEGGDRTAAPSPWLLDPPGKTLRLLRYNPVEHVSVGTRLRRDFGWGRAALTARVGTAGLELPDIDLTVQRNHPGHRMLVSFYRTLRDGHPGERGAGRPGIYVTGDPADFHWSHGAAIRFLPPAGERNWLSLRLFAEQDADIVTDTRRNRVGGAAAWRPWWGGFESGSFGGGGRASVRASAGDNPHVRAVVEGALLIPLPSRLSLGIQAGTARVWGDPAPPDLWRIGGSGRWLRGHAESVRGSRIHMTRVDLQRPITFLRLSAFGDWARASGRDFQAVGLGLVFMDGMMRLDVARGLRWDREGGPEAVLRLHFLGDTFF